jgi:hypothetical protein
MNDRLKQASWPLYLGEEGTEQFRVRTYVNEATVGDQKVHDPFIRTTVRLRGRPTERRDR